MISRDSPQLRNKLWHFQNKMLENFPHDVVMISEKKLKNHDTDEPDWLICKKIK